MAIEAMIGFGSRFVHTVQHDLESILYIILYMCTSTSGPGTMRFRGKTAAEIKFPLYSWFSQDELQVVGFRKMSHLMLPDIAIIPAFDDYWKDFIPYVKELIAATFPTSPSLPSQLSHGVALEILGRARLAVRDGPMSQQAIQKRPRASVSSSPVQSLKKGKTK